MSSRLVERYVIGAVLPYLALASLLLTGLLLTQQASRFAGLLAGTGVPLPLMIEMTAALVPDVLVLTLPVAMLAGTIIGFSRMGSDSELVALRAAGVGTWSMLWPVLLLGALLTAVTTYINLEVSPGAARALRRAGLRAALHKLDSPVEPRAFNTEIQGYVIYVRDGDKTQGQWGRVFIHTHDADGSMRLVTARSGRIDSAGDRSEMVLSDAVATKLPATGSDGADAFVTERLSQLRILINTGRGEILARLERKRAGPDEMGWRDLAEHAATRTGAEKRDAATLQHKRLTLSISPLIFALLGAGVGLRVRRGGRGLGLLLSLAVMVAYYLVSLGGEQLARAGTLHVAAGTWLATALVVALGLMLLFTGRRDILGRLWRRSNDLKESAVSGTSSVSPKVREGRVRLLSFPSLLDIDVLRTLSLTFTFAFVALVAVVLIFTLFELWRFIVATRTGAGQVARYLFFLLPLLSVQLFPASVLVAVLATYAPMARRSEAIAWWACGQSVYRLMLPGLLFALCVGMGSWLVQERLMPEANQRQDSLRAQIRGGVSRTSTNMGRQWLAAPETGRIYAYEYDKENEALREPVIFDFDSEGVHLRRMVQGRVGSWKGADRMEILQAEAMEFSLEQVVRRKQERVEVAGVSAAEMFEPTVDKPSQLSAKRLSAYLKSVKKGGGDAAPLALALQRKYADPFGVPVMALMGIPLALSFGRRSAIVALCSAIALGLAFWGISGGFQQLGAHGLLPPSVAAWSPLIIFAATATYLLSRTRT